MKNQKSRRINRKQTKRNTIKRKTTKRKTIKHTQNKKIVYNQKKMYGGRFNELEEAKLKKSLSEKIDFSDEELEKVIEILGRGGHYFSGDKLPDLILYLISDNENDNDNNKHNFMEWLFNEDDGYVHAVEHDETDNEDEDDDEV